MDNITHGLFGYALARAMPSDRDLPPDYPRAAIFTSVVASNAPDLDLLLRWVTDDPKLAYLVHHRGHTHTLLWAIPIGLACGVLVALLHGLVARQALSRLTALGGLAAALHIGFDALNNYGVHPFYPFDPRWYYGDAVFIVEPTLLAILLPPLAVLGLTRAGRVVGWVLVGVLLILLGVGPVEPAVAWGQAALLFALLSVAFRFRPPAGWTLAGVVVVLVLFGAASQLARGRLAAAFARSRPGAALLDVARSPYPGNPLCWNALLVAREDGERYRAQRADLSLWPSVMPPVACRLPQPGPSTAPTVPGGAAGGGPGVLWGSSFLGSVRELQTLWRGNCRAAAALRFLRVPFWINEGVGVIGDMRYDREPDLGFAEVPLEGSCRDPVARWQPPRLDLLE